MKTTLATILAGALLGFGTPAFAQDAAVARYPVFAHHDTYCLQGGLWGYPGSCMFSSFQQCRATAPGLTGTCIRNPRLYYHPESWS
ncbi:DUF3551 domain-containing protein [Nitrobacter sp.]|uniref:DUF3551 domain-containing protein n=1 Tax=Nitrobacter sp. TaxID=29420 RepID=UPI00399D5F91